MTHGATPVALVACCVADPPLLECPCTSAPTKPAGALPRRDQIYVGRREKAVKVMREHLVCIYRGARSGLLTALVGLGVVLLVLAITPQPALCADFHASGVKPMCPGPFTIYGGSDLRPEILQGVVEFTGDKSSKPVPGAQVTVMCQDGKVLARVDTDSNGRYTVPGMQLGLGYMCVLDPKIAGYRKGEMRCITRAFLDWHVAERFNPVVSVCSSASWSGHTCHDHQELKIRAFDPDGVEISGGVAYDNGNPTFKPAPDVTIEACSASGKPVGHARTDAQGYYEIHNPKDRGPYTCMLHPSAADSSVGYLGGVASCSANGWYLRLGQTPKAYDGPGCPDYAFPCPGGPIVPVPVHPLTKQCFP
jgi:hypothetical protein